MQIQVVIGLTDPGSIPIRYEHEQCCVRTTSILQYEVAEDTSTSNCISITETSTRVINSKDNTLEITQYWR